MAISTYAELKTAIANWLNRSDLSERIPEFIGLARTRIHYGASEAPYASEPLRIRGMETSGDITISARTAQLPAGFLQARRLYLDKDPVVRLELVSPDKLWSTYGAAQTGEPRWFALEGNDLVFGPVPETTLTGKLLYYKAFDAFAEEADTNWLLSNAPGVYLWGGLLEAWAYTGRIEYAEYAFKRFVGAVNALNAADQADRYSGSPWVARTDLGNP